MKYFGFGIPSKYLIFPFIMPIFWFLRNYIGSFIQQYGDDNGHLMKHHPIFLSFITIFGDIIAGSLNILTYIKRKPLETDCSARKLSHKTIQPFLRVESFGHSLISSQNKVLLIIFCVSFLEVTMLSGFFILGTYSNIMFSFTMNITLIIFEALVSAPILKYKIYRHQIVSIIVIFLGFLFVSISQIINNIERNKPEDSWIFYPIYISFYLLFALLDVTQKWVMENKFYTPYKLVLLQGSFSCCIFVVLFLILPFCECKWAFCNYSSTTVVIEPFFSTFQLLFSSDTGVRAIMFIVYELISAVYIILLLLTIYYFTPTQRSVSDSLASFINWILLVGTSSQINFNVMPLIGYLLVLFSCLIYNEIIILYFFGLSDYTKMEIDKRADLDKEVTMNTEMTAEKIDVD